MQMRLRWHRRYGTVSVDIRNFGEWPYGAALPIAAAWKAEKVLPVVGGLILLVPLISF
jgi:hypothetical protein